MPRIPACTARSARSATSRLPPHSAASGKSAPPTVWLRPGNKRQLRRRHNQLAFAPLWAQPRINRKHSSIARVSGQRLHQVLGGAQRLLIIVSRSSHTNNTSRVGKQIELPRAEPAQSHHREARARRRQSPAPPASLHRQLKCYRPANRKRRAAETDPALPTEQASSILPSQDRHGFGIDRFFPFAR